MNNNVYHLSRYIAIALAIYIALKLFIVLFNSHLTDTVDSLDLVIMTAILISIFILFDTLFSFYEFLDPSVNKALNAKKTSAKTVAAKITPPVTAHALPLPHTSTSAHTIPLPHTSTSAHALPLPQKRHISSAHEHFTQPSYSDGTILANSTIDNATQQMQQMLNQVAQMQEQVKKLSATVQGNIQNNAINMSSGQMQYELPSKTDLHDRYTNYTQSPQIESVGSRADGVITNHTRYDTNYLPSDQFEGVDMSYYPGWQVIPPEMWGGLAKRPPMCIESPKVCPPCSQVDTGAMNLLEWSDNLRATGPDNINTTFVKEVLNSGR